MFLMLWLPWSARRCQRRVPCKLVCGSAAPWCHQSPAPRGGPGTPPTFSLKKLKQAPARRTCQGTQGGGSPPNQEGFESFAQTAEAGNCFMGFMQCSFPCLAMQPVVCLAQLGSQGCSSS